MRWFCFSLFLIFLTEKNKIRATNRIKLFLGLNSLSLFVCVCVCWFSYFLWNLFLCLNFLQLFSFSYAADTHSQTHTHTHIVPFFDLVLFAHLIESSIILNGGKIRRSTWARWRRQNRQYATAKTVFVLCTAVSRILIAEK